MPRGVSAQERVAEAQVLLAMMCQAGLPVDVVMFNLLMTSYKKKRQWQAAEQVMGHMQACGLQPDAVSYNILIDACGKAQQLTRAFDFYHLMRRNGLQASLHAHTPHSPLAATPGPGPGPGHPGQGPDL